MWRGVAVGCRVKFGKRQKLLMWLDGCKMRLTVESEEGEVPHLRWSQAPPLPWPRPGSADSRQHQHCTIHAGGVCADHAASLFWDACHNVSDRRWIFRSQLAQVKGIAVYI